MKEVRLDDLVKFYRLLDVLDGQLGGARVLGDCSGKLTWPRRAVYFFTEDGECRTDTGAGPRVVRVGTHALRNGSRTTLWNRLSQHRGSARSGGGNHRGSIFRLIVGTAGAGVGIVAKGIDQADLCVARHTLNPLEIPDASKDSFVNGGVKTGHVAA